ncbi:hypothetical protein TIFTF001_030070 [Ficus carica]|uniref:Uncharacterized protein n=1 Tax=Ficus carica TaxID=3494 RepID=A0AA88DT26_FICCA|nr:hypothetical protein TIFTF001_030070 [Ficus carica]
MALFNNVSLVLLLLLVALSSMANARSLEVSSESTEPKFCSSCECKEENGNTRCYRTDKKIGGCPLVCSTRCACFETLPLQCFCTYEVDTCSPSDCSINTVSVLENLLAYNIGN